MGMPHSRSMAAIGARCHELRINDKEAAATPKAVIDACKKRLQEYDNA